MHLAERSLFLGISRALWAFDILPALDASGKEIIPEPEKLIRMHSRDLSGEDCAQVKIEGYTGREAVG